MKSKSVYHLPGVEGELQLEVERRALGRPLMKQFRAAGREDIGHTNPQRPAAPEVAVQTRTE